MAITPHVGPHPALHAPAPWWEVVDLVADVPDVDAPFKVVEKIGPVLETVVDLMSFDMAAALRLGQIDLLDITPPISVGDQRPFMGFTSPPFDLYARSTVTGVHGRPLGQLPPTHELHSHVASALHWYVKALGTEFLHDQFVFLWIGLETLCNRSSLSVQEPYVARCGHTIARCPTCDADTTKEVRGQTLKRFLTERLGVSAATATKLWNMRQLMHGAIPFDSEKLSELARLTQQLRIAVGAAIKDALDMSRDEPPVADQAGFTAHPAMGVSGVRGVAERDIQPLE
ncbi:MAG: hypothetical protein WAL64_06130 [Candidatus Dormiibacterota bacterium]